MRPSGRRERQRRNLPCRASPAECCRVHRESLLKPCQNFSIDRHPWFGPMRLPSQREVAEQPTECCSNGTSSFACDPPPVRFEIVYVLPFSPPRVASVISFRQYSWRTASAFRRLLI